MPWTLAESDGGYFVVNTDTKKRMSKKPLSKERAVAQLRALYANMPKSEKEQTDFTPPQDVQEAAKQGLSLRKKYGRGGLSTQEAGKLGIRSGVARAVSLSNGQAQSPETIRRMVAFFSRHEKNKNTPPEKGNGKIAWLLWGGDPGRRWAEGLVESTKEHDGVMVALFLEPELAERLRLIGGEPASEMHITLAYLGGVNDVNLGAAAAGVGKFVQTATRIEGRIGGIVRFSDSEPMKDAFCFSYDSEYLPGWRQYLLDCLAEFGVFCQNGHGFTPHITLKFISSSDPTPSIRATPTELNFDKVWLAYGGLRIPFDLQESIVKEARKKEVSSTPTAVMLNGPGSLLGNLPLGQGEDEDEEEETEVIFGRKHSVRGKYARRAMMRAAVSVKHYPGQHDQKTHGNRGPSTPASQRFSNARRTANVNISYLKSAFREYATGKDDKGNELSPANRQKSLMYAQDRLGELARIVESAENSKSSLMWQIKDPTSHPVAVKRWQQEAKVYNRQAAWARNQFKKLNIETKTTASAPHPRYGDKTYTVTYKLPKLNGKNADRGWWEKQFPGETTPVSSAAAINKELRESYKEFRESGEHSGVYVFKEFDGGYRWVTFSSNPYRDRDREIVSWKALVDDVERADADRNFGTLRWWHVPGVELGDCDFNAMIGRILVESGTFRNREVAKTIKEKAHDLEVSIGFTHPPSEPDGDGVFHHIRRFERSLCPKGRVSNRFTKFLVA